MRQTFPDDWDGQRVDLSRAWVVWHVMEHDLFLYWLLGTSVQKLAPQVGELSPSPACHLKVVLVTNTGGLVYNQTSSLADTCLNDETLMVLEKLFVWLVL